MVVPAIKVGKHKAVTQNISIGSIIFWYALQTAAYEHGWSGVYWDAWQWFHGAVLAINDVAFATDEVGYITAQVDRSGIDFVVYGTINGGASWSTGESRFAADLIIANATRVAVPESDNVAVNANNALVAGGADGLFLFSAGVK